MDRLKEVKDTVEAAWGQRESIDLEGDFSLHNAVKHVLNMLDVGDLRVAEKIDGSWTVHNWIKMAILLSFRLNQNNLYIGGPALVNNDMEMGLEATWFDKVTLKTSGWDEIQYKEAAFRSVPGSIIRHSAHIEKDVVLMPSFINVGARVGEGTMVDTWSTIGSCAQIGARCHISGGVGIGGVLEPLQANPVIIEDNCFIGARSEIAEGVIIEEGSVIAMGVYLGASTKIVHRETGDISYGRVPPYSVVVPGSLPGKTPESPHLACAVIIKQVDAQTRSKTGINDLLRA